MGTLILSLFVNEEKMKKVRLMEEKLANYVTFISGINPTRAKKQYGEEKSYII